MRQCWQERAGDRPTFTELRHWLEDMIQDVSGVNYLDLDLNLTSDCYNGNRSSTSDGQDEDVDSDEDDDDELIEEIFDKDDCSVKMEIKGSDHNVDEKRGCVSSSSSSSSSLSSSSRAGRVKIIVDGDDVKNRPLTSAAAAALAQEAATAAATLSFSPMLNCPHQASSLSGPVLAVSPASGPQHSLLSEAAVLVHKALTPTPSCSSISSCKSSVFSASSTAVPQSAGDAALSGQVGSRVWFCLVSFVNG